MQVGEELHREMAAVAARSGCELVEVEAHDRILRLVLDRPEGVTLDDCQTVSRQISALLDVEDFGDSSYTLEVSSPGLDRKLYGPHDYERFAGNPVRVTYQTPEMERKRTVVGRLDAYREAGDGALELTLEETGEALTIPRASVRVARLVPEL